MLAVPNRLLEQMNAHVEKAYPEEGAGFLIGEGDEVKEILALSNSREDGARHNRFLFSPEDYLQAELQADRLGLSLIKRALDAAETNGLDAQLDLERDLQREAGFCPDYAEGVRAFVEKRAAKFSGRRGG